MVLNSVVSEHSKRNYAKALDEVFSLCANRSQGLSRALFMEYRAAMLEKKLSASTVNVRLSAIRKLVGEAQKNGILDAEQAAKILSEIYLQRSTWDGSDIAVTEAFFGQGRDLLRPTLLIIILQRMYRSLQESGLKGFSVEVAHLV